MADTASSTHPTEAERDAAAWRLVNAQIRLADRQARWETWKAWAMILLAAAAIAAAGRLADYISPPRPQTITVHLDAPLLAAPRTGG